MTHPAVNAVAPAVHGIGFQARVIVRVEFLKTRLVGFVDESAHRQADHSLGRLVARHGGIGLVGGLDAGLEHQGHGQGKFVNQGLNYGRGDGELGEADRLEHLIGTRRFPLRSVKQAGLCPQRRFPFQRTFDAKDTGNRPSFVSGQSSSIRFFQTCFITVQQHIRQQRTGTEIKSPPMSACMENLRFGQPRLEFTGGIPEIDDPLLIQGKQRESRGQGEVLHGMEIKCKKLHGVLKIALSYYCL